MPSMKMEAHDMTQLLGTQDAAKIIGVSTDTIRWYERTGRLPATRTLGGTRLFSLATVEQFALARSQRRHHPSSSSTQGRG